MFYIFIFISVYFFCNFAYYLNPCHPYFKVHDFDVIANLQIASISKSSLYSIQFNINASIKFDIEVLKELRYQSSLVSKIRAIQWALFCNRYFWYSLPATLSTLAVSDLFLINAYTWQSAYSSYSLNYLLWNSILL
jgi:hypothetical protein